MDAAARWLVCAGQSSLLPIVAAVVSAGFEGGVDWEPSLARACTKVALAGASEGANVIVGPSSEGDTLSAACRLAQAGRGVVVLCAEGARDMAQEAAARGVTAAVEPSALGRLLMGLGAQSRADERPPEPAARPAPCAATGGAARRPWRDGAASAEPQTAVDARAGASLQGRQPGRPACEADGCEPLAGDARQRTGEGRASREGSQGAPPPAASPSSTGGLRPAGCLPRTGVVEELEAAKARQAAAGRPAGEPRGPLQPQPGGAAAWPVEDAWQAQPPQPLGNQQAHQAPWPGEGPRPSQPPQPQQSLQGLRIDVEPVVMRPVVELRQTDGVPSAGVGAGPAQERGHVPTVCFASARGGVGKSSLAVLASLSLAREGLRVALIDLDYQFGTCLGYLGAAETYGLVEEGAEAGELRIDEQALARCRSVPEGGLSAYEFCNAPEQAELLAAASAQLVRVASEGADIALVDLPPGVGEAAAQVFELSDRCLLVTDQRAFSLESLATQQGLCVRMGIARTKLVTVINRCDPRHRDEGFLSRAQFEVQTPQSVRVVDGGPEVAQMLGIGSAGELIGMRNRFALSAADMAHAICSDLGCRPRAAYGAPAQAVPVAPLAREGRFGKRRRERKGELAPCPF